MKSLIKAVALVIAIAAPVASFAQSEQPLTRAEVRAQLIQIEQAGYNPAVATDSTYPADIQAAEAAVASQKDTGSNVDSSVGGTPIGSSASGIRVAAEATPANAPFGALYEHH